MLVPWAEPASGTVNGLTRSERTGRASGSRTLVGRAAALAVPRGANMDLSTPRRSGGDGRSWVKTRNRSPIWHDHRPRLCPAGRAVQARREGARRRVFGPNRSSIPAPAPAERSSPSSRLDWSTSLHRKCFISGGAQDRGWRLDHGTAVAPTVPYVRERFQGGEFTGLIG